MKILPRTSPSPSRPAWLLGLAIVLLGGVLIAGWTWYFFRGLGHGNAENSLQGLQVFGTVPDFSLIERDRRKVTRADLLGVVWVANFIYTRCTDTCPLQSARMAALQKDVAGERGLRFLSITVDPARDTPAVLEKYADRYEANRERWWFLTGDKQAIYALIREGFRLSVEDPTDSAAPALASPARRTDFQDLSRRRARGPVDALDTLISRWLTPPPALAHSDSEFLAPPFLHSSWFVLGDRQAQIRGYYRTEEERSLKQLRRDIRALLEGR
jgi:cytochrome oxidase Cu insertion factor (SCO1/SenC/PrrC family)